MNTNGDIITCRLCDEGFDAGIVGHLLRDIHLRRDHPEVLEDLNN